MSFPSIKGKRMGTLSRVLPRENPPRTVRAVCAYWLMSRDGFTARTGGHPSRRLSVPASNSAQQGYRSSRNIDVRGRLKQSRTGQREVIFRTFTAETASDIVVRTLRYPARCHSIIAYLKNEQQTVIATQMRKCGCRAKIGTEVSQSAI